MAEKKGSTPLNATENQAGCGSNRVYTMRLDRAVDLAVLAYRTELVEQCDYPLSKHDVMRYLAESRLAELGRLPPQSDGPLRKGDFTTINRLLAAGRSRQRSTDGREERLELRLDAA